jgi:hypothetical protein
MDTWAGRGGGGASSFMGYTYPTNILLYSSVPRNIVPHIRQRYIPRLFHRLTEEYDLYFSVMQLNLSVITDEYVLVSCSANTCN